MGKINSWRELEDFIKGKARERDTSIEKLKARGVLLLTEGKPEMKMNPSINNANSDLKKADPSKEITTMKPTNDLNKEEDDDQNPRKIIVLTNDLNKEEDDGQNPRKIIVLTNDLNKEEDDDQNP